MKIETYAMLYPTMRRMDYESRSLFERLRSKPDVKINLTHKTIHMGGKRVLFLCYNAPYSLDSLRWIEICGFDIETRMTGSKSSKAYYEEAFRIAMSRLRGKERFDDVESFLGLTKEDGDESGEA